MPKKQTRNYEISRQVVSQKAPSAQIERIHVAVLLREPAPVAGPDGVVPEPTKLSDESRAELEQLVQNAVGLNITRGDSVNITSRPFIMELSDGVSTAWYEDRWLRDMAQKYDHCVDFGSRCTGCCAATNEPAAYPKW